MREIANHSWTNDLYQWKGYTNGTRSYTSNGLNQYTAATGAALSYDANANLTGDGVWSYTYDTDNRLKSANKAGLTSTLSYDPEGRLNQTVIAGVVTNLAYDGADLIAEYNGAGALLRSYVHGPGVDEPLVWYEGSGTTNKQWLYADHQGSIVATANSAGTSTAAYTYGPYGEPNVTSGTRFRYTGQQYLGPLNLYYYKARFYSPELGRFLQTDPIGYADGMNLYAYVGNNPINWTDPNGETGAELISLGVGLSPAGTAADFYTLFTGKDLFTGESVPFVWAVAGIIPGVSEMRKAGNAVEGVADVTKKTHGHHSDPKFLGGEKKQSLTTLDEQVHKDLHKDMNDFLKNKTDDFGNHMRPQRGNSGQKIRQNFSRQERLEALRDFYNGPGSKYSDAARDFFKQHPDL